MIRISLDKNPRMSIEREGTKLEANKDGFQANIKRDGFEVEADFKWEEIGVFVKEAEQRLDRMVWPEGE